MADVLNRAAIESFVARTRATGRQSELIDQREAGLRIRAGGRSAGWVLVSRLKNGKRSRIKLGQWPLMGLADARHQAQIVKGEIAKGIDPNEAVRAERKASAANLPELSLRDVLDRYEAECLSQLRRGAATRRALDGKRGLLRNFVDCDIATLDRKEVAEAVREHAKSAPIAANRCLAYASAFFNWCIEEEMLKVSPVSTIRKPAKETQRDRYHGLDELREIWAGAGKLGYPFGLLYRLLIVLPMRRDEIACMPLAELVFDRDGRGAVWTLPADRTKSGNALRVPLSPLAQALINDAIAHQDRPKDTLFVFSTTAETPVSGFAKAKRRLDVAIQKTREEQGNPESLAHWTIHDLRTTFTTLACDCLGADMNVVDRILNHVASSTTSKIKRIYNKSEHFEQRKQVLDDWAAMLEQEFEATSNLA